MIMHVSCFQLRIDVLFSILAQLLARTKGGAKANAIGRYAHMKQQMKRHIPLRARSQCTDCGTIGDHIWCQ